MNFHCYIRPWLLTLLFVVAGCSNPTAPLVIKGSKVVITNQLLSPVTVKVNGIDVGQVDAQSIRTIQRGNLPFVQVDWSLIRPQENGQPLGDTMSDVISMNLPGDDDVAEFHIDNIIGSGSNAGIFFAPLITNTTSVPMEIGVNMGLGDSERQTNVIVQPGTQKRYIGYYRLGNNSNVRIYSPEVAYSPFLFIEKLFGQDFNLTDLDNSGALDLLINEEPPRTKRKVRIEDRE